jgi:hypothetical protein
LTGQDEAADQDNRTDRDAHESFPPLLIIIVCSASLSAVEDPE